MVVDHIDSDKGNISVYLFVKKDLWIICISSPTFIGVEIILIMVTNFFWLLLVFRDDCKKRKFSENRESGGPARPKNNAPPL